MGTEGRVSAALVPMPQWASNSLDQMLVKTASMHTTDLDRDRDGVAECGD